MDPEALIAMPALGALFGSLFPIVGLLRTRRIEVTLTAHRLELRWRMWGRVTSSRTYALANLRSAYAVMGTDEVSRRLRIVVDTDDVWLPAAGVPMESVEWLAAEVNRLAQAARDRGEGDPNPALDDLLSDALRAAKHTTARAARSRESQ